MAMRLAQRISPFALAIGTVTGAAVYADGLPFSQQQTTPPAQGQTGRQGAGVGQRGQQPARDTVAQPVPVGTASISGTVVAEGTGSPVRRARVALSGAELRGRARSTITDDQGRYTFLALPTGRYTITASKAGYVDISYGAKKPGRAATPIQLEDGQKVE